MTSRLPTGVSVAPPPRGPSELATPATPVALARGEPSPSEVALALLVATIVLVPIAAGTVAWAAPGGDGDFNQRVSVQLFDLALVLTGLARIAALLTQRSAGDTQRTANGTVVAGLARRAAGSALALSITVLGTAGVIAFAVHPSPRGAELAARIGVGALVAQALVTAPLRWLTRLQALVAIVASTQALLAIAQSANGGPLGLRWLEFDGPLYPFGSSYAGRGGLTHPYHLAVLLEIGIVAALFALRKTPRRLPWLLAIAACSAGLGVTYSRAAAIGVAAAVVALAWPRRARRDDASHRAYLLAAGVMLAGVATTGLTMGDGWYSRASTSTNVQSADSGRLDRAREGVELIGEHPLAGVGPGRYAIALAANGDDAPLPAHNIVLHAAAEAGVLAGAAIAAVALLLARRYLRASREVAAAFVLVVPYFIFDAYPYVFPIGLLLTAVWFGLLERARSR
ncbi:MAG TPA: O-antigen ligase family protein [Acidimicrobiales bacterium]|nr:O-antigen ligase family protein [Acidimicrobiales bacterium]